jgi:hypothetical protein
VNYIATICGNGVNGYGDILKNVDFMGRKIRTGLNFPETPQPQGKLSEYKP